MLYEFQSLSDKDFRFLLADRIGSVMVKRGEAALLVEWNPHGVEWNPHGAKPTLGTGTAILMLRSGQLIRTQSINHPDRLSRTGPLEDTVWNPVTIG